MVSKTGYTGEEGYEIYCKNKDAVSLWEPLLDKGSGEGLIPCGLGARDTLRLEAGLPLYGHEMDDSISPIEAGLGFAVKLNKEDFIGKQVLLIGRTHKIRGLKNNRQGLQEKIARYFMVIKR